MTFFIVLTTLCKWSNGSLGAFSYNQEENDYSHGYTKHPKSSFNPVWFIASTVSELFNPRAPGKMRKMNFNRR